MGGRGSKGSSSRMNLDEKIASMKSMNLRYKYVDDPNYKNAEVTLPFDRRQDLDYYDSRLVLDKLKSEIRDVNVSDLVATQRVVGREQLKTVNKMSNNEPILVIHDGGKYFIMDGHHRAQLAVFKNKKKIKAKVYTTGE